MTPSWAHDYDGLQMRGRRGHVESYFMKINDDAGTRALWVRATVLRHPNGNTFGDAWAIAFDRRGTRTQRAVAKSRTTFSQCRFARDAIDVEVGGTTLSAHAAHGVLEHPSRIEWDLALECDAPPLIPYPSRLLYDAGFPRMKVITPLPDLRAKGEVHAFRESWTIDGWRGQLGHNWGRAHASSYAWAHCNVWEPADDIVFEAMSSKPNKLLPIMSALCLRHHGVRFDVASPIDTVRTRSEYGPRRWFFRGHNAKVAIEGEITAETDDIVGLRYENPDESITYCLNSKLATAEIDVTIAGRAPLHLRSRACALEIGTRDPHHGITVMA